MSVVRISVYHSTTLLCGQQTCLNSKLRRVMQTWHSKCVLRDEGSHRGSCVFIKTFSLFQCPSLQNFLGSGHSSTTSESIVDMPQFFIVICSCLALFVVY